MTPPSKGILALVYLVYYFEVIETNKPLLAYAAKEDTASLPEPVDVTEHYDNETSFEMPWIEIEHDRTDGEVKIMGKQQRTCPFKFHTLLAYYNTTLNVSMKMNSLMSSVKPKLISYGKNGELIEQDDPDDCIYYQGHEVAHPNIPSTMSLCADGLEGIIVVSGKTLLLEPSKQVMPMKQRHKQFVFGPHRLRECATHLYNNHPLDCAMSNMTNNRAKRFRRTFNPNDVNKVKYVEMYFVNDKSEYTWLGSNINNNMKRMKQIANIIDSLYAPLKIRAILMGVEVWNDTDKFTVDRDASVTLTKFLKFSREDLVPRFTHDCALFVTHVDFRGLGIGLAPVNGMCSPGASGNVNQDSIADYSFVAATMAHEMGHNLGMDHDKAGCSCRDRARHCIMAAYSRLPIATTFSSCSVDELNTYMRGDMGRCLMNMPNLSNGLYIEDKTCGNNRIDPGEECDCGLPLYCKSGCCDPNTCRLRSGYQCDSGGCCKDCHLRAKGTVCRTAHDSCDVYEQCDGVSSECPQDIYVRDGTECTAVNQEGYCKSGRCYSHNAQCQNAWGVGAKQGDPLCYEANQRGDHHGNCGVAGGRYVRCSAANRQCGVLHCKDRPASSDFPIIGFNRGRVTVTFTKGGNRSKCETGRSTVGRGQPNPFMVFDYVKCGIGKACKNALCVPIANLMGPACPDDCRGKGVCTSKGTCVKIVPPPTTPPPKSLNKSNGSYLSTGSIMRMTILNFVWFLLMI